MLILLPFSPQVYSHRSTNIISYWLGSDQWQVPLEPFETDPNLTWGTFWVLLTEATTCSPSLPTPRHVNPLHEANGQRPTAQAHGLAPSRSSRWADIFSCPCLADIFSHSLARPHHVPPVAAPCPASTWHRSKKPSGQVVSPHSDGGNRPWWCIGPEAIITHPDGTETHTALAP